MRIANLQTKEHLYIKMLLYMGYKFLTRCKYTNRLIAFEKDPSIIINNECEYVSADGLFNFIETGQVYKIKKN